MTDALFLTGDDVPDYLLGVELMTAGMEWPAMTGPVTITVEHIADAIVAANDDPHIQVPRIKLGHTSSLNGDHPDFDPFAAIGDAEPAFGQFHNLGAVNDGAVLTGDANNILTWLAEVAPAAYPNRSSEATWEVADVAFDVQTAGGKRYSMVVTAVSLLGVYIPAIADLEDLQTLLTSGPAALAAGKETAVPEGAPDASATQLSVSSSLIRQRFNFDWCMGENDADEDTYWWWARDIRVDPDEVIADDEEGNLWSIPFTTDGEDAITFGTPVAVRETFVPIAAARVVASFTRPAKPARPPVAAESTAAPARHEPEGVTMDENVREVLVGMGLDPDAATDEQVQAATVLAAARPDTPPEGEPDADADELEGEGDPPEGEVEGEPGAALPVGDPIAATQRREFDSLAAEVATLRAERDAANTATTSARRDEMVLTALTTGRIPPSERDHYRGLLDIDETRAGELLAALPANRVPLAARAQVPDPEGEGGLPPVGEPLPENVSLLNPAERAALRARRAN